MSSEHIAPFSDQVRQTSFQVARQAPHDPVLLGPPTLEFAPYAKIPGNRVRKDARQGTIDQDPDFIAFLESLTQPITKPASVDTAEGEEKKEAVVTTPLVQFIKEKKANKAKDSSSKSSKRSEKESKQEKVQAKKLLQRPEKETAPAQSVDKKAKDKTSKEATKGAKQATATTKGAKTTSQKESKEAIGAATEKKRERGNVAAAAKILQRDLGLSPSGGRRRGKGGSTETGSAKTESSRDSSAPGAEGAKRETAAKSLKGPPSTASSTRAKDVEQPSSTSDTAMPPTTNPPPAKPTKGAKPKPSPTPAPTATQAFLKHANPSQGVTEALLEAAFTPFGAVTKVEIDKKKGFGYVDFAEPDGLQKAMAASPVSVAQSQVVVLERKANPGGEKPRKGRGEAQQPNGGKAKTSGAKPGEGTGGNTQGSSRGSRGGRGSRNKAKGNGGDGSKAGEGSSGQAVAGEKAESSETK